MAGIAKLRPTSGALGTNPLPGGTWHFCLRGHPRSGQSVRTVEWRDREVAHGRRRFDPTGLEGGA